MSNMELARTDAKAAGWSWVAQECQRILDEIRAAREAAEAKTRGTLDTASQQE